MWSCSYLFTSPEFVLEMPPTVRQSSPSHTSCSLQMVWLVCEALTGRMFLLRSITGKAAGFLGCQRHTLDFRWAEFPSESGRYSEAPDLLHSSDLLGFSSSSPSSFWFPLWNVTSGDLDRPSGGFCTLGGTWIGPRGLFTAPWKISVIQFFLI